MMNHSYLIKNLRVNFNIVRTVLFLGVIILTYALMFKVTYKELYFINLMILGSSLSFLGYNIFNGVIREVNEGTWAMVVTSKLSPLEIIISQFLGASPVALTIAAFALLLHLVAFNLSQALVMLAFGFLVIAGYGCLAFWYAVDWEKGVTAGKSSFRVETQVSSLILLGVVMLSLVILKVLERDPPLQWYNRSFGATVLLIYSSFFFALLCIGGQIRNIQAAMKIRKSSLYWLASGWIIVGFFMGFTFINQDWIVEAISEISGMPNYLLADAVTEIFSYVFFFRLQMVYFFWLVFLFISLALNPLSAATLRNLNARLKARDWRSFLLQAPASFVNFSTVVLTFIALIIGYWNMPVVNELLTTFVEKSFIITCVLSLICMRESLVLWIFSRLFNRKPMLVFIVYLIGVWFIIPSLLLSLSDPTNAMLKLFWPVPLANYNVSFANLITIGIEVVIAAAIFIYLQRRSRPQD